MRSTQLIAMLGLLLPACAPYTLVAPERHEIGDLYTVDPEIAWSKTADGKLELWTVDGPALEAVRFADGIGDGEALFASPSPDNPFPVFRSYMSASEVADLVVDSLARTGAGAVTAKDLRPAPFGSLPGFRFELEFLSPGGLEMQGLGIGTVASEELYLILYSGTRLHYYGKYLPHVEQLIESITTTKQ